MPYEGHSGAVIKNIITVQLRYGNIKEKNLKNGRGADGSDDYLERIYTEIMSESDLKIF